MGYELEKERTRCLECGDELGYGRPDRKFCSRQCKNRYHNRNTHSRRNFQLRVLNAVNRNYGILERLLKAGVKTIDNGDLSQLGFNPSYVTSYHRVRGHNEFRCFDIKYFASDSRIFGIERCEWTI